MEGEFSWLVLVAAFAMVTGLCGVLTARLCRIIGSPVEPVSPGETASARNAGESSGQASQ